LSLAARRQSYRLEEMSNNDNYELIIEHRLVLVHLPFYSIELKPKHSRFNYPATKTCSKGEGSVEIIKFRGNANG